MQSAIEACRDDSDANLPLHGRLVHGAEDDLGVVSDGVVDDLVDLMHFAQREVRAAGDVDEHARGAGDRHVVEQWRGDGLLGRLHGAVVAAADAGAHERVAAGLHHRAHVGEVHVHQPGHADQRRDALRRVQQHLVGLLERVLKGDALADDGEETLVGHDDHRVHVFAHLLDALLGLPHPLPTFEQEGTGDDADGERAAVARQLADHRRRAGARAAAHAAGDEHQIGAAQRSLDLVPVLLDGLLPDLRARPGAEPARQLLADLNLDVRLRSEECLRVSVDRDELHTLQSLFDHSVDSVAAAAADAHDLHAGVLGCALLELEDHCGSNSTACEVGTAAAGRGAAPASSRARRVRVSASARARDERENFAAAI